MLRTAFKWLLVLGILVGGGVGFWTLRAERKAPPRRPSASAAPTVAVATAVAANERAVVVSSGTVVPARTLTVVPQVGGAVASLHPSLEAGRTVAAGETLFTVEDRDYALAVNQRKADVKRAELELTTERSRKTVAAAEWALVGDGARPTAEGKSLALREAQLDTAAAGVTAAKSALSAARLNLRRTSVVAPFDALVTAESLEIGQVVAPGAPVATLVASDAYRVRVEVPVDRLPWLRIPGVSVPVDEPGSPARVLQSVGGEGVARQGRVVGLLGELDAASRTARVLVEVAQPLAPLGPGNGLPLLLGSYVGVEIEGPMMDGLVALPRAALRDGDTVWIAADGSLARRSVELVWGRDETAYVRGELRPGEQVVTTRLDAPVVGMAVRLPGDDAPAGRRPPGAPNARSLAHASEPVTAPASAGRGEVTP